MTTARHLMGTVVSGAHPTVHLAFPNGALHCNGSLTLGNINGEFVDYGVEPLVAALLYADIEPGRLCRRCVTNPEFHHRHADDWTRRLPKPRRVQISRPCDLVPEAQTVLDTLMYEGIALPVAGGAVVVDVEQAAESLRSVLDTPVGTGGDRKLGALALFGVLGRNGVTPEPAHLPVPGVTGPGVPAPAAAHGSRRTTARDVIDDRSTCTCGEGGDRQQVNDAELELCEYRSTFVDGYTDDDIDYVLTRITRATGVRLVCVWNTYDDAGFGGDSQLYVHGDGEDVHELGGYLEAWLGCEPTDADMPADPGDPREWQGPRAHFTLADLPVNQGHNWSRRDDS